MLDGAPTPPYTLKGCIWELTLKCPLGCPHCGSKASRGRPSELRLEESFSVADQLVALGCKNLTLIGGEVFLYKGWEQLSRYLTDRGVNVTIVTNGYCLGEPEVEQLKRAGLVNIGISIGGMNTTHSRVQGRADAFQRLQNALDRLNRAGIPVAAITSLTNFNCADLEDVYHFLVEHSVRIWQLQLAVATGSATEMDKFIVPTGPVQEIVASVREKNQEWQMRVLAADAIGYLDENETYIRENESPLCYWGGCSAGISSVFIDSAGNVKGCGALYDEVFIEGNVRKTSLANIWNHPNAFAYNRHFTPDLLAGKCQGCEIGDVCRGGCRSANYFTSQSLYANTFCCRV